MRFVAVGDALVDVVSELAPRPQEHRHGKVVLRAGGSSVNAALVARSLGAEAQVVARVGSDPAGDLVVTTLERRGIEARVARDDELPTGTAIAVGDAVIADRGANARLSPGDLPPLLAGDALLVSGFALFQDGSREAAQEALRRFEGTWTAVDLASPRLARLDFEARVVFATKAEADTVEGLDERFEIVCRKDDYGVARTAAFGAGDAFAAAFLVALAEGAGVEEARAHARAVAARAASAVD